jgi:hypothetical protein
MNFQHAKGYYRKFIAGFSAIARPLTNLLKKENEWRWTEQEQASFDFLKFKLTSAPLPLYPDFNKPFMLTTDASGYATLETVSGCPQNYGILIDYYPYKPWSTLFTCAIGVSVLPHLWRGHTKETGCSIR